MPKPPQRWLNNLLRFPKNLEQIRDYLVDNRKKPTNRKLTRTMLKDFSLSENQLYWQGMLVVAPDKVQQLLEEEYKDIGAGMGIPSFYRNLCQKYVGITRTAVTDFMRKQTDYQLTRPYQKKINQPHIYTKKNSHWCMDLADFRPFRIKHKNYLLVVIDSFTRHLWLRVLRVKTKTAVAEELRGIIEEENDGEAPSVLHSDNGKEFRLQEFCEEFGITQVFSKAYAPESNALAEGTIRIIRNKLSGFMVRNESRNWHLFVPETQNIWNRTVHGGSQYTPEFLHKSNAEDVEEDQEEARQHLREKAEKAVSKNRLGDLEVGDFVRIAIIAMHNRTRKIAKTTGRQNVKTHALKWSPDVYVIKSITRPNHEVGKPKYTVETRDGGEVLKKKFYANQLQKVSEDAEKVPRKLQRRLNRDPDVSDDEEEKKKKTRNRQPRQRPPTPPPREPSRRQRRAPRHFDEFAEWSDHDDN